MVSTVQAILHLGCVVFRTEDCPKFFYVDPPLIYGVKHSCNIFMCPSSRRSPVQASQNGFQFWQVLSQIVLL